MAAGYVVCFDNSLTDFIVSVQQFPQGGESTNGHQIGWLRFCSVLRGFQGLFAIVPALFLLLEADSVTDVVLNFTAIHSVSQFDELVFVGLKYSQSREPVEQIENTVLPPCMQKPDAHNGKVYIVVIYTLYCISLLVVLCCYLWL